MGNWDRKAEASRIAIEHTQVMREVYKEEIATCIEKSLIYGGPNRKPTPFIPSMGGVTKQGVLKLKTDEALFKYGGDGLTILLNFASYKNPGGKFIEGAMAQEEALCHASYLFNVLGAFVDYYNWNDQHKNNALYTDRAIYTPGVRFFDNMGNTKFASVLTCAAPNRSVMLRYGGSTEMDNLRCLESRVKFIRDIIAEQRPSTIILGAWGCGVFKQDANVVSRLLGEAFENIGGAVIYAIPDDRNYNIFLNSLRG